METDLRDRTADAVDRPPDEPQDMTGTASAAVGSVIDETAQCIGHYPFSTVAVAFAGGLLVGWLISNTQRRRLYP